MVPFFVLFAGSNICSFQAIIEPPPLPEPTEERQAVVPLIEEEPVPFTLPTENTEETWKKCQKYGACVLSHLFLSHLFLSHVSFFPLSFFHSFISPFLSFLTSFPFASFSFTRSFLPSSFFHSFISLPFLYFLVFFHFVYSLLTYLQIHSRWYPHASHHYRRSYKQVNRVFPY